MNPDRNIERLREWIDLRVLARNATTIAREELEGARSVFPETCAPDLASALIKGMETAIQPVFEGIFAAIRHDAEARREYFSSLYPSLYHELLALRDQGRLTRLDVSNACCHLLMAEATQEIARDSDENFALLEQPDADPSLKSRWFDFERYISWRAACKVETFEKRDLSQRILITDQFPYIDIYVLARALRQEILSPFQISGIMTSQDRYLSALRMIFEKEHG